MECGVAYGRALLQYRPLYGLQPINHGLLHRGFHDSWLHLLLTLRLILHLLLLLLQMDCSASRHGTAVAGIAAAGYVPGAPMIGVAPQASLGVYQVRISKAGIQYRNWLYITSKVLQISMQLSHCCWETFISRKYT